MKRIFAILAAALSLNAFADAPKEPVQLAASYDPKAPSISVQGLGNKILDAATAPKYLRYVSNGTEYAYSFKRLEHSEVKYIGRQSDIDGLVFFEVTAYKDGGLLNSQLSVYRQSKYANAIKLEKFDRNEKKPYQFDLGTDSAGRIFGISSEKNVTYFSPADSIKEHVDIEKKANPAFF